jgi:4-hydroxy-3-polyprenylbenzoate decarboxylase
MAYADLREFIKVLEKHGELRRIKTPVSSDQEITEITDRISKAGGPHCSSKMSTRAEFPC